MKAQPQGKKRHFLDLCDGRSFYDARKADPPGVLRPGQGHLERAPLLSLGFAAREASLRGGGIKEVSELCGFICRPRLCASLGTELSRRDRSLFPDHGSFFAASGATLCLKNFLLWPSSAKVDRQ